MWWKVQPLLSCFHRLAQHCQTWNSCISTPCRVVGWDSSHVCTVPIVTHGPWTIYGRKRRVEIVSSYLFSLFTWITQAEQRKDDFNCARGCRSVMRLFPSRSSRSNNMKGNVVGMSCSNFKSMEGLTNVPNHPRNMFAAGWARTLHWVYLQEEAAPLICCQLWPTHFLNASDGPEAW